MSDIASVLLIVILHSGSSLLLRSNTFKLIINTVGKKNEKTFINYYYEPIYQLFFCYFIIIIFLIKITQKADLC